MPVTSTSWQPGQSGNRKTMWKPGQSGNPAGRPRGSRDAISKQFIDDLAADWRKHGREAIETVRKKDVSCYVRLAAQLCPREDPQPEVELTRAQVKAEIAQLMKDLGYEKRVNGSVIDHIPGDNATHAATPISSSDLSD